MATVLNAFRMERSLMSSLNVVNEAERPRIATVMEDSGAIYGWEELRQLIDQVAQSGRNDRVVLYRHGATNYNDRNLVSGQHDTALSDAGRQQAKDLRGKVPRDVDLIVCSALSRAMETMSLAIPTPERVGKVVFADARLNEVHLGDLQGRRRRHLPEFEAGDLDFAPPNGETYRQAARRVFSAVADIFTILACMGGTSRTAAVFCHAGVLRIVATLTSGSEDSKDVFRKTLGNAETLEVCSDAVRVAEYWGNNTFVD